MHRKRYGAWAGNPEGYAPDLSRCCESLHGKYHPGGYQCTRPAKYGPGAAYCKQHDPEAVKARARASERKYLDELNRKQVQWHGASFLAALRQIADGHNDPRSLAREVIEKYDRSLR